MISAKNFKIICSLSAVNGRIRVFSLNLFKCILTHLSGHSWKEGKLIAGMSASERKDYESNHDGLTFAYDGMRVSL